MQQQNTTHEIPLFVSAPLAEITTLPFRRLVRHFSDKVLLYTEMLSAGAVNRGGVFNVAKEELAESDPPIVYQLLGNNPEEMGRAAANLANRGPFAIDINMGCSAPEIRSAGMGAALLKEPGLSAKIIEACRKTVPDEIKISAKLRAGFENDDLDYLVDFCKTLQNAGCSFITLHPRTARQQFKRNARWDLIAELHKNLALPLVGNGDVAGAAQAVKYLNNNYCDAVMIGRKAIQCPWIFREGEKLIEGIKTKEKADLLELSRMMIEYTAGQLPQELHKSRLHRFYAFYTKNFKFGHALFAEIRNTKSPEIMHSFVRAYIERNPAEQFVLF